MGNKANRNGPCPCGSGEKYKNCCYGKGISFNKKDQSKYLIWVIVGAGVIIAGIFISDKFSSSPNQPAQQLTQPIGTQSTNFFPTGSAQPPGPAPPGQVWSAEHGHWHDINTGNAVSPTEASPTQTSPQPPGEPPPGKVWAPEHGHWHDDIQTPSVNVIEIIETPSDS